MKRKLYEGVRVLDFSNNLAGPSCGAMLADYGAEVIHIEKPVLGDDCRTFLPQIEGVSMPHLTCNHGKKSVVLDLKDSRAVRIVKELAQDSDIVIESSRPGVMKRLGLDYETLREINPRLIYCSISAFGQTGPYAQRPGYDIIAQAVSGIMYMTGDQDGPARKIGVAVGDYIGGLNAFGCIGTAMYYREVTGEGQHIDLSLARNLMWMSAKLDYPLTGKEEHRNGNHHLTLCPYGIFNGKNGQSIVIATLSQKLWEKLCCTIGREDLIRNPDYLNNRERCAHMEPLVAIIEEWLRSFPDIADAEEVLADAGIPCSRVFTHKDINEDPHFNECGWIIDLPVQHGMKTIRSKRAPSDPFGFSACMPEYGETPALGQHNVEILSRLGMAAGEIEAMEQEWNEKARKK